MLTITKLQQKVDEQTKLIASLKQVLRIPRLPRLFLEQYEEIQTTEQVESWQRTKEMRQVMTQYADEEQFNQASLNLALQIQFENEMDLQKMKERIAKKLQNDTNSKDQKDSIVKLPTDQNQKPVQTVKQIHFQNLM